MGVKGSSQNARTPLIFADCCLPLWRTQWRCLCGGSATPCQKWMLRSVRSSWWGILRKLWVPVNCPVLRSTVSTCCFPAFLWKCSSFSVFPCVRSSYPRLGKQDKVYCMSLSPPPRKGSCLMKSGSIHLFLLFLGEANFKAAYLQIWSWWLAHWELGGCTKWMYPLCL